MESAGSAWHFRSTSGTSWLRRPLKAHQTKIGAQRFNLPSRKLDIEIRALLF
jgi:hypothetical protein